MKKTYSQIIAMILAGLNTLAIFPGAFGLAASVLLLSMVFVDKDNSDKYYLLSLIGGIWLTALIGVGQYIGYVWHSFRRLSRGKALTLWIGTIVYNAVLIVINLIVTGFYIGDRSFGAGVLYPLVHLLFCLTVIVLSILALRDELKKPVV